MNKNEKVLLKKFKHINDVLKMDSTTINAHTLMSFQDSSGLVGDSGALMIPSCAVQGRTTELY